MGRKTIALAIGLLLAGGGASAGEKNYGPGVSDSEIKLGQSIPYSGPASAFSPVGRVQVAYFKMLNATGGINGRKVELTSVESTLTGDMDVRGALGVDDEHRNGFERISVSFRVTGNAPEAKLREVVERVKQLRQTFSTVSIGAASFVSATPSPCPVSTIASNWFVSAMPWSIVDPDGRLTGPVPGRSARATDRRGR